jgi:UDP-N-acetylmuramoylalanine--D-glutamate ligase
MATRSIKLSEARCLVVGLGDTGLACVRWLRRRGVAVRATDTRAAPAHAAVLRAEHPEVELRLGGFAAEDFAWADVIVASPGIPVATPEIAASGKMVVGDVELFGLALLEGFPGAAEAERRYPAILAITGSNGKSTVTTMVGAMCARAGLETCVAGNIGLPVLDALSAIETGAAPVPDVFVLELSSFQLETTYNLFVSAATVLNISEDHMDRYPDMAKYAVAKGRIFHHAAVQVLNREDPYTLALSLPYATTWTFGLDAPTRDGQWGLIEVDGAEWLAQGTTPLMARAELRVAGRHNAANALAALALCQALNLPVAPLLDALRDYAGLAHRVEFVAEVAGVRYYDDSKGTNVGATEAALRGFEQPVLLIAGGDGKGQDFAPLRAALARARALVLIGRDAPLIEAATRGVVAIHHAASLEAAVALCHDLARPGDVVLLSPACASFDMFRNYAHRAEVFIEAVRKLADKQVAADCQPPSANSAGSGHVL